MVLVKISLFLSFVTTVIPLFLAPPELVTEEIVLGHKISGNGIEINKAKLDTIEKLPLPTSEEDNQSFIGMSVFTEDSSKTF